MFCFCLLGILHFFGRFFFLILRSLFRIKQIGLGTVLIYFFCGPIWIFQINWISYHGLIEYFQINWRSCRGSIHFFVPLLTLKPWVVPLYQQKETEQLFEAVLLQFYFYLFTEHAFEDCNLWNQFQSNPYTSYPASFGTFDSDNDHLFFTDFIIRSFCWRWCPKCQWHIWRLQHYRDAANFCNIFLSPDGQL